jgi:hypothetical protein
MLKMLLAMTVGALAVTNTKQANEESNFSLVEAPKKEALTCPVITDKENFEAKQDELELMWEQIQELKHTDPFAAQIKYEKYRALAGDIPPAVPSLIVEDQAVS